MVARLFQIPSLKSLCQCLSLVDLYFALDMVSGCDKIHNWSLSWSWAVTKLRNQGQALIGQVSKSCWLPIFLNSQVISRQFHPELRHFSHFHQLRHKNLPKYIFLEVFSLNQPYASSQEGWSISTLDVKFVCITFICYM